MCLDLERNECEHADYDYGWKQVVSFFLSLSPVIVFHSENPAGDAIVHKSSDHVL